MKQDTASDVRPEAAERRKAGWLTSGGGRDIYRQTLTWQKKTHSHSFLRLQQKVIKVLEKPNKNGAFELKMQLIALFRISVSVLPARIMAVGTSFSRNRPLQISSCSSHQCLAGIFCQQQWETTASFLNPAVKSSPALCTLLRP